MATVVADERPLQVVQPGEGPFDDEADAAEASAVLALATEDLGCGARMRVELVNDGPVTIALDA